MCTGPVPCEWKVGERKWTLQLLLARRGLSCNRAMYHGGFAVGPGRRSRLQAGEVGIYWRQAGRQVPAGQPAGSSSRWNSPLRRACDPTARRPTVSSESISVSRPTRGILYHRRWVGPASQVAVRAKGDGLRSRFARNSSIRSSRASAGETPGDARPGR